MKQLTGVNLWEVPADLHVITTNGTVKMNGACVMGRGCAREAKYMYPSLDLKLGRMVKDSGNIVHFLNFTPARPNVDYPHRLASFPVKHNWWEQADTYLIERSAKQLVELVNTTPGIMSVVMPRPGCGNGQLNWQDVRPLIEPILDDRFTVVTF